MYSDLVQLHLDYCALIGQLINGCTLMSVRECNSWLLDGLVMSRGMVGLSLTMIYAGTFNGYHLIREDDFSNIVCLTYL